MMLILLTTQAAINLRKRIYNNTINVSGMVPSPYLGAGQSSTIRIRIRARLLFNFMMEHILYQYKSYIYKKG